MPLEGSLSRPDWYRLSRKSEKEMSPNEGGPAQKRRILERSDAYEDGRVTEHMELT